MLVLKTAHCCTVLSNNTPHNAQCTLNGTKMASDIIEEEDVRSPNPGRKNNNHKWEEDKRRKEGRQEKRRDRRGYLPLIRKLDLFYSVILSRVPLKHHTITSSQ